MSIAQKYLQFQVATTDLINSLPSISSECVILRNLRNATKKHLGHLVEIDGEILPPESNLDVVKQISKFQNQYGNEFPFKLVKPSFELTAPVNLFEPQEQVEVVLQPKED